MGGTEPIMPDCNAAVAGVSSSTNILVVVGVPPVLVTDVSCAAVDPAQPAVADVLTAVDFPNLPALARVSALATPGDDARCSSRLGIPGVSPVATCFCSTALRIGFPPLLLSRQPSSFRPLTACPAMVDTT
jgi:hypothetical protein